MSSKVFADYVWGFYGPRGLYGDFFHGRLSRAELDAAVALRALSPDYAGDTIDRERVRDILLVARNGELPTPSYDDDYEGYCDGVAASRAEDGE